MFFKKAYLQKERELGEVQAVVREYLRLAYPETYSYSYWENPIASLKRIVERIKEERKETARKTLVEKDVREVLQKIEAEKRLKDTVYNAPFINYEKFGYHPKTEEFVTGKVNGAKPESRPQPESGPQPPKSLDNYSDYVKTPTPSELTAAEEKK
jgi:glutamyl-tRNA reductase